MFYYSDPLSGEDVEVTDVASAFYALKICNDNHFGVYYQGQEMLKELARNSSEIYAQKYALVEPYLPVDTSTALTPTDPTKTYADYGADDNKPKIIPTPLPDTVPQNVIDAMEYLDEQYSIESQRLHAELEEDTAELKETIGKMEAKVATWFKGEISRRADWLGGRGETTLSGCWLQYSGNEVSFNYTELEG